MLNTFSQFLEIPISFQSISLKRYSFKPTPNCNLKSKDKRYYFITQNLTRSTSSSINCSKRSHKVSFQQASKQESKRSSLVRRQTRRLTNKSSKSKFVQKVEPKKILVRRHTQIKSNYSRGYNLSMNQYIQQWKTLKQQKKAQKQNQTSYQSWYRTPKEEISLRQNKLTKIRKQNYQKVQVKPCFNIKNFPKIFRKPQKQLNGNANLCQFNKLLVVNTQNYCFFETEINHTTDYRNYLANNVFQLDENKLNSKQSKDKIYFCALDGQEVESENFFWISCVLNCEQRSQIIQPIRKFLKQIFEQTIEIDYDYLIGSTIWIVDWKGRVSYLKIKQIDVSEQVKTQEEENIAIQQLKEEKSKDLYFNRKSLKKMVWEYSSNSLDKNSLQLINIF